MLALSLMYYYYNAWSCDSTPCTELGRFNTDLLLQMTSGNVTLETWQWFPTVGRNTKRTELHTKLLVILHFFIQVEMLYPSFLLLVYCIPALYFNSSKWKRAYYKKELSYLLIVLSQFNSRVHKIEKLKIIPWTFFSSSHIEISPVFHTSFEWQNHNTFLKALIFYNSYLHSDWAKKWTIYYN